MEGQEIYLLGRLKGVIVILIALFLVYLVLKTNSFRLREFLNKFITLSEQHPIISISNILVISTALLMVLLAFTEA